jgi:hypothetical protein
MWQLICTSLCTLRNEITLREHEIFGGAKNWKRNGCFYNAHESSHCTYVGEDVC